MNFAEVLKRSENTSGEGSKDIIKLALCELDAPSRVLMRYMQDPLMVFGVKKFDRPETYSAADPVNITQTIETLDQLSTRQLTGNAARSAVTDLLSNFTSETAKYIERVIGKDPKAGFSEDTYNIVILAKEKSERENIDFLAACKAVDKEIKKNGIEEPFSHYSAYPDVVPTFTVQLADKCETAEDFEENVDVPCLGEFKYDGERNIAVVTINDVIYFNRSGKIQTTVSGLFDEDLFKIRNYLGYDFVLDGERCSDLGFTDTINAKKDGNQESKNNLRFRAFFLMPLSDWKSKKTNITTRQNRTFLTELLSNQDLQIQKIKLAEGREVTSLQDIAAYCNDAIDLPENKIRKIEGLILKKWDSTYTWDRSFDWIKVKRMYDVDGTVVDFYPGKKGTRLENTLGGVTVEGFLESGERFRTNVGSGFSDALRDEIWANKDEWTKLTLVIKYQEVSKSKSKTLSALRFPTFSHTRDDKIVDL